jgi:glycosyltransferase involved in cell wall biosynthesis
MNRTLTIGIDAHYLDGFHQGVRTLLENNLEQFKINGNDAVIVLYHRLADKAAPDRYIHKKLLTNAGQFNYIAGFPYQGIVDKLDLFHSHYILPIWMPCKTVVGIYDILYELYPQYFGKYHTLQMRSLVPRSARVANKVITISEFTKKEMVDRYQIPPEKIEVVYCGVSDTFRKAKEQEIKTTLLSLGLQKPYILCVGRMAPIKNMSGMLRAFADIARTHKDHILVIVGSNDHTFKDRNSGVDFNRITGLHKRIIFTGAINNDQLVALYSGADLFVFPSFGEGFGLPVLEAMACGTPVICSNVTALPEVAGDAAVFFDPKDQNDFSAKLSSTLGSSETLRELSIKGPKQASKFTWRRSAEQTLDVYRQVMKSANP